MADESGTIVPSAGMSGRSSAGPGEPGSQATELDRACGELELMRRRCLSPLIRRMAVSAAAIAVLAGSMAVISPHPDPLVMGIVSGIAMLSTWAYWARLPREDYREFHRARFIPAAVRALGRYSYDPNGTMPRIWMGRSGLLPEHHVYLSRGMYSAERSGIFVQFAQVQLKRFGTYPTIGEPSVASSSFCLSGRRSPDERCCAVIAERYSICSRTRPTIWISSGRD